MVSKQGSNDWPIERVVSSLKINMKQFSEQLGCILQPSDDIPNKTNFDRALSKFGLYKAFDVLDECMPPADQASAVSILYPFMTAASYIIMCYVKRSALFGEYIDHYS